MASREGKGSEMHLNAYISAIIFNNKLNKYIILPLVNNFCATANLLISF